MNETHITMSIAPGQLQILLSGLSDTDDLRLEELRASGKLEMHPTKVNGRWAINIVAAPKD